MKLNEDKRGQLESGVFCGFVLTLLREMERVVQINENM